MKFWKNPTYIFYTFLVLYFIGMIVLSFFRDMIKDESLYFRETWLISELLKNGKWIGEYAVGLHGFIFKLPPAIIFLFTGPSVEVVTIYNILLSIGVGYLFYRLAREFLKDDWYALWATVFLMVNFHFLLNVPTYMREIPSLLIILLFVYSVLKNWNKYWLSLIFLLLLDTKEYVFLVFAIFYIIWVFVILKKTFLKKLLHLMVVFIPSIIWILLMFLTNIIPVNMYFASIVGLIDESLGYTLKHFDLDFTSVNLVEEGKLMPLIPVEGIASPILLTLVNIVNAVLSLIGKILYPRTFSFLSVPKVVIFPVIFTSILILKRFFKERKGTKVLIFSSLLILVWIVFYILRSSHGRYLLPIVPSISIMFIYFLFYSKFTDLQKKILVFGTGIFMTLGFVFESSYVIEKIAIELILFVLLCIFTFKPKLTYLKYIFLSVLISVCAGVALLFSYTQGQIHDYLNWGENREADEISKAIPDNSKYWINNYENQNVVAVYEQEQYSSPEWKWDLDPKIKEYRELSTLGEKYGYNFDLYDIETFKETVKELDIKYVIFLKSDVEGDHFDDEEYIETMKGESWLNLKEDIQLEGKELVIFELKE